MTKYEDLIKSLKQGKLLPLYLFFGEEEFLVQEAVDLIISKAVDPGARDFNFNTVYCKGSSGNEIVNLAQTFPFMSERRLVIAKEIEALKAGDLEELVTYLKSPSPTTCLVMISNQLKYEKKAVISAVEANGAAVRFYALLDGEMLGWIDRWARQRGLAIQRDAAQYVWQTLGNDLQAISNELEKTAIYIKVRKNITYDDVKAVVGDFRDYTPFDLAAALGAKNREKAFLILSRLVQEGAAPVGLLGSIAWNFRRLMQVKAMEFAGTGLDEGMKKLRPPVIFHQAAAFKEQVRSYSLAELEMAFEVLLNADKAMKSSGIGGRLVLERMIMRLCGV
ncbi:MAG: DNA polymerase III subunit delta [Nitrospirota bacterium]